MSKQEFVKAMLYLGTAYGKEISQGQMQIWYEYFINIDYTLLIKAIKKGIASNKFIPSVAELVELCKKSELEYRLEIIEKMYNDGYFKKGLTGEDTYLEEMSDYNKTIGFIGAGIIPSWLEADMISYGYKTKMIGNCEQSKITSNKYLE